MPPVWVLCHILYNCFQEPDYALVKQFACVESSTDLSLLHLKKDDVDVGVVLTQDQMAPLPNSPSSSSLGSRTTTHRSGQLCDFQFKFYVVLTSKNTDPVKLEKKLVTIRQSGVMQYPASEFSINFQFQ